MYNSSSVAMKFLRIFLKNCSNDFWKSLFSAKADFTLIENKDLPNILRTVFKLQEHIIKYLEAQSLNNQISMANNSGYFF
ncbi:hypothetical protein P9112_005466 [Eukaryota sp. TZLM1-RC]